MISEIGVARALELTTTYSVNDHSTIVDIQATTERRFTLKRLRDMIITYRQMHHTHSTAQSFKVSLGV